MKTIEIFDPAMCCSTGVCGPSVDTDLLRMATVLENLKKQGVDVIRHNLKDEPQVFVDNKEINEQLMKQGIDVLPITVVDGDIVLTNKYPTNEQLEEWTGVLIQKL